MKNHKVYFIIFQIALLMTTFFNLGIIIFGLNKGFDITDEGFNLLGILEKQEMGYTMFNIFYILKSFFHSLDLLELRILRLVYTIIISVFLAYSIVKLLKDEFINISNFLILSFLIINGNLIAYSFTGSSISYNNLSTFFAISSLSLIFYSYSFLNKSVEYIFLFLAGICTTLLILTKFNSGILLTGLIILFILFFKRNEIVIKYKLQKIFLYSLGIIIMLVLFHFFFMNLNESIKKISTVAFYLQKIDPRYSKLSLIMQIVYFLINDNLFFISNCLIVLVITYLTFKISNSFFKKVFVINLSKITLSSCTFILLFLICYRRKEPLASPFYSFLLTIVSVFIIKLMIDVNNLNFTLIYNKYKNLIILIILLYFIPISLVSGTNNSLLTNLIFNTSFVYLIIWILIQVNYVKYFTKVFYISLSILLVFASHLLYKNYIITPYRIQNLTNQTQNINFKSKIDRIYLDNLSVSSLNKLYKYIAHEKNRELYPISRMPGLCYIFNKTCPGGIPWSHESMDLYFLNLNKKNVNKSKLPIVLSDFKIENNNKIAERLIKSFEKLDIYLKVQFTLCDSVEFPFGEKIYRKIYIYK